MKEGFEILGLEPVDIDRVHQRALEVMSAYQFKETDFIEPYGQENVNRDLEIVRREEEMFERNMSKEEIANKKIADILEGLIVEHGELSLWLGEFAQTIKTSKYDDYNNGVDLIVEFRGEQPGTASYLGLAADVTFSPDSMRKFERIKTRMDKGELSRVKYFHSELMNIHGQLGKLPEVIIAVSKSMVLELAEMQLTKEIRAMAEHRIQIMMLHQIKAQLETFTSYAELIGRDDMADIYRSRLEIINNILEQKKDIEIKVKHEMLNDEMHTSMMSFLRNWKKKIESGSTEW